MMDRASAVGRIEREVLGDLTLPPVAVREQPLLVVVKLLARLGREFEVRPLDDGIDRARLLAQAAVDAFDHVDVVARGPPRAVVAARSRLDGDRLGRADRLAQLAGDAALLAVGIAAQNVLAAEARRDRALLERIVERRLGLEEIAHRQDEGLHELLEERRLRGLIQSHLVSFRRARVAPSPYCGVQPASCSTAATTATMASESGRNTFQPNRISWS